MCDIDIQLKEICTKEVHEIPPKGVLWIIKAHKQKTTFQFLDWAECDLFELVAKTFNNKLQTSKF